MRVPTTLQGVVSSEQACPRILGSSLHLSVFQAGLASPENSEQLIIALEPEAASIYCRKLRLHQMIELSSKAVVNGYSASDTVGAGFTQGTSALSLPPLLPQRHLRL